MAWFFLELIVKSMALEKTRLFYHSLPLGKLESKHVLTGEFLFLSMFLQSLFSFNVAGEDIPPMQLKEGVFRCIMQLYDCLLTEVHERCKKGLSLAKRLNSSLAFFCYDLLSIVEPRQVFEFVGFSASLFIFLFFQNFLLCSIYICITSVAEIGLSIIWVHYVLYTCISETSSSVINFVVAVTIMIIGCCCCCFGGVEKVALKLVGA